MSSFAAPVVTANILASIVPKTTLKQKTQTLLKRWKGWLLSKLLVPTYAQPTKVELQKKTSNIQTSAHLRQLVVLIAAMLGLVSSLSSSPPPMSWTSKNRRLAVASTLLIPPYACCSNYALKTISRNTTYPESFNEKLRRTFSKATAPGLKVLELGAGKDLVTVLEAGCYSGQEHLTLVDPTPPSAAKRAAAETLFSKKGGTITFCSSLSTLPPSSFDAATSSFTLCSVLSPRETVEALSSMLKPSAPYAFVEHVASEDDSFFSIQQRVLDPLQQAVASSCHLRRRSHQTIAEIFSSIEYKRSFEESMWPVSEQVAGVAYK